MKILVLGLDCAAPELLFGFDDLPNIRRLMEVGAYGRLESVIPPITVPAWMCLATSKDPGSLGIYGFRNRTRPFLQRPGYRLGAIDHRTGHLGPSRPRRQAVDHHWRSARLSAAANQWDLGRLLPDARYRQKRLHASTGSSRTRSASSSVIIRSTSRDFAATTRPGFATKSSP